MFLIFELSLRVVNKGAFLLISKADERLRVMMSAQQEGVMEVISQSNMWRKTDSLNDWLCRLTGWRFGIESE